MKSLAAIDGIVPVESSDPRDVDVLVVHADDVLTALAATAQGRETVLRVTPPFRRRQRGRIHVPGDANTQPADVGAGSGAEAQNDTDGGEPETAPMSVEATEFVDADAPSFPHAPDTEPAPAESPEYDVDEHFERHEDAVTAWREAVPEHFRGRVTHELADGRTTTFDVKYLGT